MICKNCGAQINDSALLCEHCGGQVPLPSPEETRVSSNITLGQDGKYRWVYEMNLYTNPTVFLTVWKMFFFIIAGACGISVIADLINSDDLSERIPGNLKVFGFILLGMTALVWISCLIYAAMMGGKYIVQFEMDEQGINHIQIPEQAAKARKLSRSVFLAGGAAKNPTAMGIGMNSARTEMYSDFSKVRKIKAYPRRHLIKVNAPLNHNQVYVSSEDFEFVKNFITDHCSDLK